MFFLEVLGFTFLLHLINSFRNCYGIVGYWCAILEEISRDEANRHWSLLYIQYNVTVIIFLCDPGNLTCICDWAGGKLDDITVVVGEVVKLTESSSDEA